MQALVRKQIVMSCQKRVCVSNIKGWYRRLEIQDKQILLVKTPDHSALRSQAAWCLGWKQKWFKCYPILLDRCLSCWLRLRWTGGFHKFPEKRAPGCYFSAPCEIFTSSQFTSFLSGRVRSYVRLSDRYRSCMTRKGLSSWVFNPHQVHTSLHELTAVPLHSLIIWLIYQAFKGLDTKHSYFTETCHQQIELLISLKSANFRWFLKFSFQAKFLNSCLCLDNIWYLASFVKLNVFVEEQIPISQRKVSFWWYWSTIWNLFWQIPTWRDWQ